MVTELAPRSGCVPVGQSRASPGMDLHRTGHGAPAPSGPRGLTGRHPPGLVVGGEARREVEFVDEVVHWSAGQPAGSAQSCTEGGISRWLCWSHGPNVVWRMRDSPGGTVRVALTDAGSQGAGRRGRGPEGQTETLRTRRRTPRAVRPGSAGQTEEAHAGGQVQMGRWRARRAAGAAVDADGPRVGVRACGSDATAAVARDVPRERSAPLALRLAGDPRPLRAALPPARTPTPGRHPTRPTAS